MDTKIKKSKKNKSDNPVKRDQKIKVVHIITKLELGGAQLNTIYTFKNLDQKKFDTYLISGNGGLLNNQVIKWESFIIIKNLFVYSNQ